MLSKWEIEDRIERKRREIRDLREAMWTAPDWQVYVNLDRAVDEALREISELERQLEELES